MGRQFRSNPPRFVWGLPARTGDVVLVWRRSGLQAHRVIARASSGWITAGDAAWHADPIATDDAIVAVAPAARSVWRAWWNRVRCHLRGRLR